MHTGLDISQPGENDYGESCYAVETGVVEFAGKLPGTWGNVILIRHPSRGLWSQYAHLASVSSLAQEGMTVQQGQRIGTVGNADGQLSAHLHFELRTKPLRPGHWPSGKQRLKTPAVHAFIRAHYTDPRPLLGA